MKTKKYAIFEHNLIFNKIKYQVGKRYKKDKFLFRTKDIRTLILDYLVTNDLTKQIEIRIIYEYDDYYVIHNEINYYEDFDSNVEPEYKNLLLLLRYRDKNIINKNIDSMSIYEKIANGWKQNPYKTTNSMGKKPANKILQFRYFKL